MNDMKEEIKIEEQKIYDQLRAEKCVIALEGLHDDALDGGWSYKGITAYVNILEADSQSKIDDYLALLEANKALYDQIEAQVRVIAKLEKENEAALDALGTLTFLAETSGGTAGKDEKLCQAIEQARSVLLANKVEQDECNC